MVGVTPPLVITLHLGLASGVAIYSEGCGRRRSIMGRERFDVLTPPPHWATQTPVTPLLSALVWPGTSSLPPPGMNFSVRAGSSTPSLLSLGAPELHFHPAPPRLLGAHQEKPLRSASEHLTPAPKESELEPLLAADARPPRCRAFGAAAPPLDPPPVFCA